MLAPREALLRAATLGAVLGAIAGGLYGLVAHGDQLLVPLYALLLGGAAGTVLLAGTASALTLGRRWRAAPADDGAEPA